MELRWDGVPSLADALSMLREQAARTPAPQWVRVVGGWSEFQFAERRMPTLGEINAASPDVPVFVLHLYDRALLNRAALRAVGYTRETPVPVGRSSATRPESPGMLVPGLNANIPTDLSLGPASTGRSGSPRSLHALLTVSASPASSTRAAASRTTPRTTRWSRTCTGTVC